MSQQGSMLFKFEEQFKYFIRHGGDQIKFVRDSYNLDFLGFVGAVPMLFDSSVQACDSSRTECNIVEVDEQEPQGQQSSVEVGEVSEVSVIREPKSPNSQQADIKQPVPVQLFRARSSSDTNGESLKSISSRLSSAGEDSKPINPSLNSSVESLKPISPSLNSSVENFKPISPNLNSSVENLKPISPNFNNGVENFKPVSPGLHSSVENLKLISPNLNSSVENLKPIKAESKQDSQAPVKDITGLALQGKKVIIRTNSMSGQKSLIFRQKTGGNVEIPAKFSTFLDAATPIKKEVIPTSLSAQVHPSNVAHVVFPQSEPTPRHRPPILRRFLKSNKKNASEFREEDIKMDIKCEEQSIFVEDQKIFSFDHDYFNIPVKADRDEECVSESVSGMPNPPSKVDEVIEIDDDDEDPPPLAIRLDNVKALLANSERQNQNCSVTVEGSSEKLQEQQFGEQTKEANVPEKRSEERFLGKIGKINEHCLKKMTPTTNYEIVNTNLFKKAKESGENKNRFILMITKKEMLQQKKSKNQTTVLKPVNLKPIKVAKEKVPPSGYKFSFRSKLKDNKKTQTDTVFTKNAETNTDDFLLDELIEKRIQERALRNKVSRTTNTEEDRITISPSPLLLSDPSEFLEYLDGPNISHIIGENADFGTGPTMGQINASFTGKSINNVLSNGKLIDSCLSSNITDISYTKGMTTSNGSWSVPEMLPNMENAWPLQPASQVGQNGRPRVEPWKLQLFLDLKNCHQFDSSGNMLIHNAVIQNNLTQVRRQCLALRTRNIDINTLNHNSFTALQLALLNDASVAIVQLLLQSGADTSVMDSQGNSVLHLCVTYSSEAVLKSLLSSTVCADINGINFEGYTPLILCAMYQKYVKADDLLSTGANPNICDKKSGRTALFHAVEVNDTEMVKLLLNYKAKTKLKNFFGTSPHDAMFELDSIDPVIRKIILAKEDHQSSEPKPTEVKRKRKRKSSEDRIFTVTPYHPKKTKSPRS